MREILFRGKAVNRDNGYRRTEYKNGDWVYGLLTRPYDERFEELPAEMTNTLGISGIEVDHESVGQYTGLTDKSGTKIFEGDIVKCTATNVDCAFTAVVLFGNPNGEYNWGFQLMRISGANANTDILLWVDMEETGAFIEVIGNIYDNPELIGGKTNGK